MDNYSYLVPFSRQRSLAEGLNRRGRVLRTVETVGRFRRSYTYDPSTGVSSNKVAFEEYRSKTDWKTPFEQELKALTSDIDNFEPRIKCISDTDDLQPSSDQTIVQVQSLSKEWDGLKGEIDDHKERLAQAQDPREYVSQVYGKETWTNEDTSSPPEGKRRRQMYSMTVRIREIAEKAERIIQEREVIKSHVAVHEKRSDSQSVDSGVVSRQEAIEDSNAIEHTSPQLINLHNDISNILQWIADRQAYVENQEMGQNYEHVQVLQRNLDNFIEETESVGSRKVAWANESCDQDMSTKQADDAPLVALWKDNLNEAWENLLESMRTSTQLLDANVRLHKFFHDCRDVQGNIQDKMRMIPDELSRDSGSVPDVQRKHQLLASDLENLDWCVEQVRLEGQQLVASYAGEKASEILECKEDVVNWWNDLQIVYDYKRFTPTATADLVNFMQMAKDLSHWMVAEKQRILAVAKPRGIISAESVRRLLQEIKSDMDLHQDAFSSCVTFGRQLFDQDHYGSHEIEKKLIQLTNDNADLVKLLGEKWEHLELVLHLCDSANITLPAGSFWSLQHGPAEEMIEALNRRELRNSTLSQEDFFHTLLKVPLVDLRQLHKAQMDEGRNVQSWSNLTHTQSEKIETTFRSDDGFSRVETTLQADRNGSSCSVPCEGYLMRKHAWASVNRRAKNRKWEKLYCVLHGHQLWFYKDRKHRETGELVKGLEAISLTGNCAVEMARNYTKRHHVLAIRLEDGAEYLIQAQDHTDMNRWLEHFQQVTGQNQVLDRGNRSPVALSESSLSKTNVYLSMNSND